MTNEEKHDLEQEHLDQNANYRVVWCSNPSMYFAQYKLASDVWIYVGRAQRSHLEAKLDAILDAQKAGIECRISPKIHKIEKESIVIEPK